MDTPNHRHPVRKHPHPQTREIHATETELGELNWKPYSGAELLDAAASARACRDGPFLRADPKATLLRPCAPWLVPCQAAGDAAAFDATLNSMADLARPAAATWRVELGSLDSDFGTRRARLEGEEQERWVRVKERGRGRGAMVGGAK